MSRGPHSCVLLADRHHGLAEGVRGLLETAFGTVVMVADKASLQDVAFRLQPDVAVVDVSLARDGGLGWLEAVRARCPGLKVIALSVHDEESVRRAALQAGADEFVVKRAIATDLLPAVERVRAIGPARRSHAGRGAIMKVVIVGGVAGGASCAARLRRLDEKAEILMVERGPYVSYANCGLPYHVSGVIPKEASLLVANEPSSGRSSASTSGRAARPSRSRRSRRPSSCATSKTGEVTTEPYDKLVLVARSGLHPAAAARHRPARHLQVRTVPDARTIREWIERVTEFLTGCTAYSGIQSVKAMRAGRSSSAAASSASRWRRT